MRSIRPSPSRANTSMAHGWTKPQSTPQTTRRMTSGLRGSIGSIHELNFALYRIDDPVVGIGDGDGAAVMIPKLVFDRETVPVQDTDQLTGAPSERIGLSFAESGHATNVLLDPSFIAPKDLQRLSIDRNPFAHRKSLP